MTMDDQQTAALLVRNELALLDPDVRRDRTRVGAFLAEDFFEYGSSGRVWTREAIMEPLATEEFIPPAVEEMRCRIIAPGVALVTYRTVRIDANIGARSAVLRSSLWTLEAGGWRMRFHQGTSAHLQA
jgi:hypothetical protein